MKLRNSLFYTLIVIGLVICGCSRQLVPGLKHGKEGLAYDSAAYNYDFVEAIRQKMLGNFGEAMKDFEDCIALNPRSDASYYQMAQMVLANGDLDRGKKYMKKAYEVSPDNLWYTRVLASIYYQHQEIDSAIMVYESAIKKYPDKADLQLSLANLYSDSKNYEKAKNILNRLDNKYGINETTTEALARNLIAERKYRDAMEKVNLLLAADPDKLSYNGLLAEIYEAEGENEKVLDVYNRLIKRNPDNPQVQLALCNFLVNRKNYGELFSLLDTIILNERITKEEKVTFMAGLIGNKDIIKDHGKEMESAIKDLESVYSNDDIVIMLLPEFLQNEGKLKEASAALEKIINEKPDDYFAWEKLLLVYFEERNWAMLEKAGKECATKFNRSVIAKLLYANGAMENKHYEVAIDELRKADILAGDNNAAKVQVLSMKAEVYYRMKNYTDAFKSFDEALSLNDTNLVVLNNYAYYLAEQNQKLNEAEKMAKEVVSKAKDNTTYLDTYAWVLYKQGKEREAARIMEKIINSGEKKDAEWFEHYGYILKKMGKCSEAVDEWKKALNIDKSKTELTREIENCEKRR